MRPTHLVALSIVSIVAFGTMTIDTVLPAIAQGAPSSNDARNDHGIFTGDAKMVFFVSDVKKSVAFYRDALGFAFHHYHDYDTGKSVKEWHKDKPPIYAEMSFAGRRFGIHLPTNKQDKRCVGASKVYFRVKDLDAHHRRAVAWNARPSDIQRKPWMDMFHVVDPDGHRIYFAYTDDHKHGNPWFGE